MIIQIMLFTDHSLIDSFILLKYILYIIYNLYSRLMIALFWKCFTRNQFLTMLIHRFYKVNQRRILMSWLGKRCFSKFGILLDVFFSFEKLDEINNSNSLKYTIYGESLNIFSWL